MSGVARMDRPALLWINPVSAVSPKSEQSLAAKSGNHFAGIDLLRGYAAVAVVLLHACVPYASPSMGGLSWSISSEATSAPVTVVFWAIELVIMPIFLVIAGFFAARSFTTRGAWETTKNRIKKLGWPFFLAILFLLPFEFYIWMLGWVAEGQVSVREVRRMKFGGDVDRNLWGFSHLWFLPYLISYVAILGWAWSSLQRWSGQQIMRIALPACFFIAVVSLMLRPEIVWGFQHAFLPVPTKWIYSGTFFAAGGCWFLLDPKLSHLARQGQRMFAPAILLSVAAVGTGIWWLNAIGDPAGWMEGRWSEHSLPAAEQRWAGNFSAAIFPATGLPVAGAIVRLSIAVLTVAAAAMMTFSLMGVALARTSRLGKVTTSLAKASFVIYLLHHPVVGLAHIAARFAAPSVSPVAKVVAVTGLGVAAGWSVSWLLSQHRLRVWERSRSENEVPTLEFPRPSEAAASKVA